MSEEPVRRTDADELRSLFLFESLDDAQLESLVELGYLEDHLEGETLYTEGDPATCFYVLLSGELSLNRRVRDGFVELTRTDQRGVYAGATASWAGDRIPQVYANTVRITRDATFLVFPAPELGELFRQWFPMAVHFLEGLMLGIRNSEAVVGQRERLLALGQLSAGLTHELNNPAAAAVRATATLRERVAGMRHKLGLIANGKVPPQRFSEVVVLQEETVERVAKAPRMSPMQQSDAEDELADWMDERGLRGADDITPVLAAGGLDAAWADEVAAAVAADDLEAAMRWLTYSVETEQLMGEIEDATTRISTLLAAVKQYSGMDRGTAHEPVDVVKGLESTLAILGGKLRGVHVVRDWGSGVPTVPGYAAELNQVWTNLIDNALGAMDGTGTLTLSTELEDGPDGGHVVVTVRDTGAGVPQDIHDRIFEPFFTTKDVGEGTGLGLDISYRIVTKHRGAITVTSEPGDTRFAVRLPVQEA